MKWNNTPPMSRGWYWYDNCGNSAPSLHFVSQQPGHPYLCIEDTRSGFSINKKYKDISYMSGKWSDEVLPPASSGTEGTLPT